MTPNHDLRFGDCISGMAALPDNSVHLTISSIPFEELFAYSSKLECVSNNGSTIDIRAGRFALNMRFVVEQLFRVTATGCNVCIHIQQLLAYRNQHGFMGRRDFRGAMIDVFGAGGFQFIGEVAIPKCPQQLAQRLNLHSLQFKTGYARDANNLAPAVNDYVLIFQKPGESATPVRPIRHRTNPNGWITTEDWIKWAHGVWDDILQIDVLDGYRSAREHNQEKHVCLARNSLVLTRTGYVPIQDVSVGDLVLTHRGRWQPVLAKQCNGKKPVVQTLAQGVADLLTTPDHLLYARRGVGVGRWPSSAGGVSHPRKIARSVEPEWMSANECKGHYLNLPLPPVEESSYSEQEWWIVGRWLGDGHFDSRNQAHISCGHKEAGELVAHLGSHGGAVTKRRTGHQIAISDRDGSLRDLLKKCGRGAAGKRLPAEALALNQQKAEALLSGYLSADGHYVRKYDRWSASSVSKALVLGMAMVAQRARNVVASVFAGRPEGTATIEGRSVRTKQDWVLAIPPRNLSGMILEDGAWKKVRHVDPAGEAEVWDLQIAEDSSFVAEGCVVHNCPLQLDLIRRCVLLYSNPISIQPDVTVLDPFMGIGSTAYVCLGGTTAQNQVVPEPRNVIGFELKESYYEQSLKNCERAILRSAQREQDATPLFAAMQ